MLPLARSVLVGGRWLRDSIAVRQAADSPTWSPPLASLRTQYLYVQPVAIRIGYRQQVLRDTSAMFKLFRGISAVIQLFTVRSLSNVPCMRGACGRSWAPPLRLPLRADERHHSSSMLIACGIRSQRASGSTGNPQLCSVQIHEHQRPSAASASSHNRRRSTALKHERTYCTSGY